MRGRTKREGESNVSIRSFKYYAIGVTNTPQPLIGTTLTAATVNTVPKQSDPSIQISITVADTTPFLPGDDAALLNTDGSGLLTVNVVSITDATHMVVQGLFRRAYPVGAYLSLATNVNSPYVQCKPGNAAAIGIGSKYDVSLSTGVHLIAVLEPTTAGVQPVDFSTVRPGFMNPESLVNYWVVGTANDSYLPSFGAV